MTDFDVSPPHLNMPEITRIRELIMVVIVVVAG